MADKKVIFITGPAGCGKTLNAAKLANFFGCAGYVDEATAGKVRKFFDLSDGDLMVLALPDEEGLISCLPGGTEIELHDYYDACRLAKIPTHDHTLQFRYAMEGNSNEAANRITFIIAPVGCAFHHISEICQSIGATFFTEIGRTVKAAQLPQLINPNAKNQAVFINSTREALHPLYPEAQIIGYYDACRAAGVSPFHTGTGQLIAPLNHAASLAAAAAEPLKPRETYGVLMEVATERAKQISKGFDASHDDRYNYDDLTRAAIVYALKGNGVESSLGRKMYPWPKSTFKDEGPRANLIKAAALLVAEIERMDRAEAAPQFMQHFDND